jgi:DUF1365 family protein
MKQVKSAVYQGNVVHRRLAPTTHRLSYRVFSFYLALDELDTLTQRLRLFSYNRFNLFSFYDNDHGPGENSSLKRHIDCLLQKHGVKLDQAKVMILCYPRVLGYVFNPLTVYYCHDKNDVLKVVIYEVNNTFGERHSYVIPIDPAEPQHQSCTKTLSVSPFTRNEGDYRFHLQGPDDNILVGVDLREGGAPVLKTYFTGKRSILSDRHLLWLAIAYPFMTLKVIIGIHFEALRLWLKGLRLFKRRKSPSYSTALIEKD